MAEQLSDDLVEYKTIILSLVSYAMHPKLDELIEKLAPEENNKTRFLIKNEIKRLAKSCPYTLDLRSYFADCEAVEYQNVFHYLDAISKTLFLESIEKNNGLFSLDIYNKINEQAKERHIENMRQEQALQELKNKTTVEPASTKVKSFSLINTNLFQEPPLDVSSKCGIFTYDPLGMSRKGKEEIAIAAEILDINQGYCAIKTKYQVLDELEQAFLWFYDHSKSLEFTEEIVLQYSIEESKEPKSRKFSHYRLKLNKMSDIKMRNHLAELLRLKVDVSKGMQDRLIAPLYDSVFAKGHEQLFLSKLSKLVLLCQKTAKGLVPSSSLSTKFNQPFLDFFRVNQRLYPIINILTHNVINEQLKANNSFSGYAFLLRYPSKNRDEENDNLDNFGIIWQEHLGDKSVKNTLKNIFYQGNYRFVHIHIQAVNALVDAYNPCAVPDHISPTVSLLNKPIGEQLANYLERNHYLVQIEDVTDINSILSLAPERENSEEFADDESHNSVNEPIKLALKYRLPAKYRNTQLEEVQVKVNDVRCEERFDYAIKFVITKCDRIACKISGVTVNISTKGLSIKLDKSLNYKAGDVIQLNMEMPYRKRIVPISKQMYQIVGGNDEYNLRLLIADTDRRHVASYMIREFIYQNMENLKVSGTKGNQTVGLETAMRNIYANNHSSIPFFVHRDKKQWFISSVALNKHSHIPSLAQQNQNAQDMFNQLIEQGKFRDYCMSQLNLVDKNNSEQSFYLLVLPRNAANKEKLTFWFNDLNHLKQSHHLFEVVEKIRLLGTPTILKIRLTKPKRIMDKYYRDELELLKHLDIIKAEDVERHIENLLGMGEISDHSQQVLALIDDLVNDEWNADF